MARLTMYETTLEEARELAAQDPAVRAGRLAADVFTWWAAPANSGTRSSYY